MSAYCVVHYPPNPDFICGLTEDDCADLVSIDWVSFIEHKISFWHPCNERLLGVLMIIELGDNGLRSKYG